MSKSASSKPSAAVEQQQQYGRTIKVHDTVYDILSCMMTGSDSFNGTITKLLVEYFKSHKKDREFIQYIMEQKKVNVDLKQFMSNNGIVTSE